MWPKPSTGGAAGLSSAEQALGINPPVGGEDFESSKGMEHMKAFADAHAKGDHKGMHEAMKAHHAMCSGGVSGDEAAPE